MSHRTPASPPSLTDDSPNSAAADAAPKSTAKIGLIAAALLVLGLLVAPFFWSITDVLQCFLPWARASGGTSPWNIYVARPDCNYPPLWVYVLTAVERCRLLLGAGPESGVAIALLKLPSLVASAALVVGTARYLRDLRGVKTASSAAAVAVALGIGVWFDAAIWGQADAPLCLLLAASAWALLRERSGIAGLFAGLALALKLQAIVALPFLLVYALKRLRARETGKAAAVAVLTLTALALPFFLASRAAGHGVIVSYTGAVGQFQTRSTEAYNLWHVSIGFDKAFRHWSSEVAGSDAVPILGPLTPKQIGLAIFAAVYAPVVWRVWRRPEPKTLLTGIAVGYIAFFMICTEMHERYVLPGIVFLAMAYGISGTARRLYPAWNVTSGINNIMSLSYFNRVDLGTIDRQSHLQYVLFRGSSVLLSFVQTALLIWLLRSFFGESAAAKSDRADKRPV